ncbi:type III secretion apparatus assembly protein SctX [Acanthopleuribacter pedis]|uniref:Uncharacterized protein n=1 Tax=Acanthopleuribacter pedis TaxID=442870 RepID=A0A8J7QJ37_9BACT|nr:hypothetical protein [Acanthopleuribacter pedis]MBO1323325.1 hypothetical protein [Acanthopleuribacter pedis]
MIRNETSPFRGIERVFYDRRPVIPAADETHRGPSLPAETGKQASLQHLFPDTSLNSEMVQHLDQRLRDKRLLMPGFYSEAAAGTRDALAQLNPETEEARAVLDAALNLLNDEVADRDILDAYRLALREV